MGDARLTDAEHRAKPVKPMQVQVGAFQLSKTGAQRYDLRDPYHIALSLSWRGFFALFGTAFLLVNVLFACIYLIDPHGIANARPRDFGDAFFFSVQTLATVGYGVLSPATLYTHIVSAVEIWSGMAFAAIFTGLLFVRFSRPRVKVLYAEKVVVAQRNGRPTLMVRLANGRMSLLTNAEARLSVLMEERTLEGQRYRRPVELKLERSRLPIFGLTWTLMHDICEDSPLYGYDADRMAREQVRLFMAIEAFDEAMNARVQDMHDFGFDSVLFGWRYQDAITIDENGATLADLTRLSLVEPDVHAPFAAGGDG